MNVINNWGLLLIWGCIACTSSGGADRKYNASYQLDQSADQLSSLLEVSIAANKNPRTIKENGEIHWATKEAENVSDSFDWTLGFFPGTCWYMYEYTKDEKWSNAAQKFQNQFEHFKTLTSSHDLGFVFYCSYGNAYRLSKKDKYKDVLIAAGESLLQRYNPVVGCIKSWDVDKGWQATRGWRFPVIIDNMMNLEMLFELSKITDDPKYRNVAISHANTTLKNHFREDNSSYHVVDYDPETGEVRKKNTAQGYAHESAWARGQAWGLYGFTICYRYTGDQKYLAKAKEIANYITSYASFMKGDGIPYWDYHAPNVPGQPKDASAAAITASALLELNNYTGDQYRNEVNKILYSLAGQKYTARRGENSNFVLKHSVGSIPHNNEIDVPINYADYYYIEALMRLYKDTGS